MTMTTLPPDVQQRRLAAMHNRTTLYELVATDGVRTVLLSYCRKARGVIFDVACKHGPALVALTGDERIHFAKLAADGATMGAWKIKFTGRTERDCCLEGVHDWIGKL
jgi:hypothetical protein